MPVAPEERREREQATRIGVRAECVTDLGVVRCRAGIAVAWLADRARDRAHQRAPPPPSGQPGLIVPLTSIAFEVPWKCPRCSQPLLVNGVAESLLCPHCHEAIETPPAFVTQGAAGHGFVELAAFLLD